MGKHIIFDSDLYRIDLDDGEWVDILEKCPNSVSRAAQSAMLKAKSRVVAGSKKDSPIDFDLEAGEFNREILEGMVKAWSFTYPEGHTEVGQLIPVTPENIGRMDETASDVILETVERLNPTRSEDQKKG